MVGVTEDKSYGWSWFQSTQESKRKELNYLINHKKRKFYAFPRSPKGDNSWIFELLMEAKMAKIEWFGGY